MSKWKVIFRETKDGRLLVKRFDDVGEAVSFTKPLLAAGGIADIVSANKAWAPQEKRGPRPSSRHYWCPYCIQWRVFKVIAIRLKAMSNVLGPPLLRCPICQVSVSDAGVRKYNHLWDDSKQFGNVRE